MSIVFLVLGLGGLVFGANLLVDGASALSRRFGVSPLVIGLTVVAFGTSAPELTVSLAAALGGAGDISYGNVVGSNIANILLILGLTALIQPLQVASSTVRYEIPMAIFASVAVAALGLDSLGIQGAGSAGDVLSRGDSLVLLGFFGVFLLYTLASARRDSSLREGAQAAPAVRGSLLLPILKVLGGLALLVVGGKLLVDGAVEIAQTLGVSQRIIGLTIVAVGTSMPELATSIAAALKGEQDIAVGNIVGSNIFNVFCILGIGGLITPLEIPGGSLVDSAVHLAASLILLIFALGGGGRRLDRWEGGIMLAGFLGYTLWLVL